jgi:hypothetical protein
VADVGEEKTLGDGDVCGVLVGGGVGGALVGLPFPTNMGIAACRRSETGGSLSRRVNVAACPSLDVSSARASAKGGERGGRRPA